MRKIGIVVAVLTLGVASMAWGHVWGNQLYFAVQFPDENIPVVDGILNDWVPVPEIPYLIGNDVLADMYYGNTVQGEIDVSDMSIRSMWGWNDNNNLIYAMAEVFDDVHIADRDTPNAWWADDAWEIYVDPLHIEPTEQDQDAGTKTSLNVSFPPGPPGTNAIGQMLPPFEWRDEAEDGIQWGIGWGFEGEMYGESTYFYEIWFKPWDFVAPDGDIASVEWSDLEEDQLIHMSMAFDDDDDGGTERTNFWSTSDNTCCAADSDMILNSLDEDIDWGSAPTAVQSNTWGRIKSQFSE